MRKMKDSGISWINEIPVCWNVEKIKHHAIKIERGTSPEYTDEPITKVVNQATFSKGFFDKSNIRFSTKPADTSRGLLEIHDVLVASTGGGVLGKTHLFQEEDTYVADGHITIIRTNQSELNSAYLRYFLGVNYETINAVLAVGSTNQTELQRDLLANMFIPYPPLSEQKRIADFLDGKCAEIDGLVADIQSQIDTLEQYKRSVITETVTKGLNPDVEMKDSCIQWIGKIPEHWQTDKLRYHLVRNEPKNPGNQMVLSLYRELGVIPKDSRDDNHNVTSEDTSKYKYVRCGDFVVNKMKAWQGSVSVSDYEGIVSPAYYVYHFTDGAFNKRYFHFLLRSCYKDEFMRLSGGIRVGQWDLPSEALDNTPVLIPPVSEQKLIADFLDEKISEIDIIIDQKKEQLTVLENYKKSLIYEYVTGKQEVPV